MAIEQHFSEQFHTKLSKGTSLKLYQALHYSGLSKSLRMRWQELKNKRRLYLRGNWSNLQRAQDILSGINEYQDTPVNQLALSNLLEELEAAKNQAPIYLPEDHTGWIESFTPKEYQEQVKAFQFVLKEFEHPYDWRQIPHKFYYKSGIRSYCKYEMIPYLHSDNNGGHLYRMEIDYTGEYHSGKWYTYGRNSLGWRANGIKVTQEFNHEVTLVHEVTHAIENYRSQRTKKKYTHSEMNTTLMELRFARQHYPEYFRKLTPVMDGRRNEWYSPVPPLEGMDPAGTVPQDSKRKAAGPSGS